MDSSTSPPATGFFINPNYFRLWLGQAISLVGDFVFDITLVLWVATSLAAGQSWAPLAVSGVLFAATVPSVLLGPFAGVFVDRWDKRRTMLLMDLLRAALIGLLLLSSQIATHLFSGIAIKSAQLAVLYAVVFATTLCAQFFNPARLALIGDVVDPTVRTRASGLGQTTMHLAAIIGPAVAGPLYFHFGTTTALAVNALSFVGSFAAILMVRAPAIAAPVAPDEGGHVMSELRAGLSYFRKSRALMTVLISSVLVMIGAGSLNALDVFFATNNLHTSASNYGLLSAAMGSGAVLGAILTSTVGARIAPGRVFGTSMVLAGAGLVLYSRMGSFWAAVIILFLIGIPVAALNVAIMPIILEATPRRMLGRVSSVMNPLINLATLGSVVLAGWLAGTAMAHFHRNIGGISLGPIDTIFLGAGFVAVLAGIYAVYALGESHGHSLDTPRAAGPMQRDRVSA